MRPPPPEGRVLFRFSPPYQPRDDVAADVRSEYAVTDWGTTVEVAPIHYQIIIWGWNDYRGEWESNVGARPVVFELLRMAKDAGCLADEPVLPGDESL